MGTSETAQLHWKEVRWETPAAAEIFFGLAERPEQAGTDGATLLPPHTIAISETPHLGGMALNAYPNGLEIGDQPSIIMSGLATFGALMGVPGVLFGIQVIVESDEVRIPNLLLTLFTAAITYFAFRWDTSGYRYQPILFDRAARRVHIFVDRTSLLWPWPLFGGGKYEIRSYDWDCLRAQIKRQTLFTGNVARTEAQLQLVALKSPTDPTIVDQVGVGYTTSALAIQPLIDAWEHLRRFMQHQGPLLVEGDAPFQESSQASLWGAVTFLQPFIGPGARENLRERDPMMWVGQVVAGLLFPVTMFLGLLRWTVYRMKSTPKWPREVRDSIGDGPLQGEALGRWRNIVPPKSASREAARRSASS